MRILVTGGSGFIGTNLVKQLCNIESNKIVSLDNYSSGDKEYNWTEQGQVTYHEVDVSDITDFSPFTYKPDYVVHLAALPRIQFSIQNPDKVFKANMIGLANVLNWCKETETPLVFAGTSSVHGDKLCNPYTGTKWMGEKLIQMYSQLYYMDTAVLRFYNVYGDPNTYQDDYGLVMTIFEKQYANNEPLTITGDGEQRRDFTHVSQICDGIIKAGEALASGHIGGFNEYELGTGKNYSINELAEMFDHPVKYIPARDGEMKETLAKNELTSYELKWEAKDLLKEYVDSLKKKYDTRTKK